MRTLTDADYNLILDFYDRKLSPNELEAFNFRMEQEDAFVEEVAQFYILQQAVVADEPEKAATIIPETKAIPKQQIKAINTRRRTFWLAAATIALAIMVYTFWQPITQNNLASQETTSLKKRLNGQITSDYDKLTSGANSPLSGPILIKNGQLAEGMQKMKEQLATNPHKQTNLSYYYGVALFLYEGNYTAADKYLDYALDINSDHRQEAAFYSVIVNALNKNTAKANKVLVDYKINVADLPSTVQDLLKK